MDDFEMLGQKELGDSGKSTSAGSFVPRPASDMDYAKHKTVSSVKFHPTKHFLVALAYVENLSFDQRAEISGRSFNSSILIYNFADPHIITTGYILETPVEVSCLEFHPENPNMLIGGCISG
jgi:hypothetical protein